MDEERKPGLWLDECFEFPSLLVGDMKAHKKPVPLFPSGSVP